MGLNREQIVFIESYPGSTNQELWELLQAESCPLRYTNKLNSFKSDLRDAGLTRDIKPKIYTAELIAEIKDAMKIEKLTGHELFERFGKSSASIGAFFKFLSREKIKVKPKRRRKKNDSERNN